MKKCFGVLLGGMMLVAACMMSACEETETMDQQIPDGYVAEGAFAQSEEEKARMFDRQDVTYIYNYCPSVMQEGENVRHIYYCANLADRAVIDAIAYRRGILIDGVWYWSPEQIVLTPSANTFDYQSFDWEGVDWSAQDWDKDVTWDNGAWDRRHVCDPSVVKGEFSYQGEKYSYLMAYLGCYVADRDNEIGLAVAKSPAGPWVRVEYAADPEKDANHIDGLVSEKDPWTRSNRAFISFDDSFEEYYDSTAAQVAGAWGVGQPSLISVDKKGKILIFYTLNGGSAARVMAERWDLSDLSAPVREFREELTMRGITQYGSSEASYACSNSDLGYDPAKNRFYIVGDAFPFPTDMPNYIAQYSYVGYMNNIDATAVLGDRFVGENRLTARWNEVDFIDEYMTGYARNHNAGLVRDEYGWIPKPDSLEVCVTASTAGSGFGYTYRISRYTLDTRD